MREDSSNSPVDNILILASRRDTHTFSRLIASYFIHSLITNFHYYYVMLQARVIPNWKCPS
jgi:hypothetical protein